MAPLSGSQVVALAEFHAVVTQDVVGGGDVEKVIWHQEVQQVLHALEVHVAARSLQRDGGFFSPVNLGSGESLHVGNGLVDAGEQLGKAGLDVFELGRLGTGEARGTALGHVGGELH